MSLMADALRTLEAAELFRELPRQDLELLAAAAIAERHRARAFIFLEGDPARWLYLVKGGRVKILKQSPSGKEVALELLGPGEIFGGVAVFEGRPYPASAQAVDPTEVLKVPAERLLAVAERHPQLVRRMALLVGQRLRRAHERVRALAVEPVERRLAGALLRLAEREGIGKGGRFPYRLTRQNLAELAGTTVETTIRILARWRRDGLIADEEGRLLLRDLPALRTLAGGGSADP